MNGHVIDIRDDDTLNTDYDVITPQNDVTTQENDVTKPEHDNVDDPWALSEVKDDSKPWKGSNSHLRISILYP